MHKARAPNTHLTMSGPCSLQICLQYVPGLFEQVSLAEHTMDYLFQLIYNPTQYTSCDCLQLVAMTGPHCHCRRLKGGRHACIDLWNY